jgi:hypothetical protein
MSARNATEVRKRGITNISGAEQALAMRAYKVRKNRPFRGGLLEFGNNFFSE